MTTPAGLAFDSSGNLYVADPSAQRIFKYSPGGRRSVFETYISTPFGLAFDQAGDLFVSERGSGEIVRITPDGVVHSFAAVDQPFGLAFDGVGNLYVTSLGDATIKVITPAGTLSTVTRIRNLAPGLAVQGSPTLAEVR